MDIKKKKVEKKIKNKEISIIIPAFNEQNRLEPTLKSIIAYIKKYYGKYEIIVIDDGSTDATSKIISKYKDVTMLKNKINRGKGYSVRKGLSYATYSLVLFSDSDLATPIEELEKLEAEIDTGSDIAIASRNLSTSKIAVKQPLYRQFLGNLFPYLVRVIALRGIQDTQCGFKLYTKDAVKIIVKYQRLERFSFDVEQLFIARKHNLDIAEVGVRWIDKEGSKVDTLKDGLRMLKDLFVIRINAYKGYYG